jgi:hypothetical protein
MTSYSKDAVPNGTLKDWFVMETLNALVFRLGVRRQAAIQSNPILGFRIWKAGTIPFR